MLLFFKSSVVVCNLFSVVLLWFYVACFWCQSFGDVSPNVCSYNFSSVSVAEWPPFGGLWSNRTFTNSYLVKIISYFYIELVTNSFF